jgi:type III secretion protein L
MTRIIRAGDPRPGRRCTAPVDGTRVIHAAQLAAQREAEALFAEAQAEAALLLGRARAEAEALRASVREEASREATRLLAATEARTLARLEQSAGDLTELGVRIAEKILGAELRQHPEQVAKIVAGCLRRAAASRRILIRVNPEDVAAVEGALGELRALARDPALLATRSDPSIARGGCILETEAGQIDGQLQTQLAAVREALEA